MSLKDVLSPFKVHKLCYKEDGEDEENIEKYYERKLKTEEFEVETTYGNIVNFSKPYIDSLFEKYKNYLHNNLRPLHISAQLYFYSKSLGDFCDGVLNIYNKMIEYVDYRVFCNVPFLDDNFKIKINQLKIIIHISYNFLMNPQMFDVDEDEIDLVFNETINTINEEECVICYGNKPNIIYTDCYHFCVCSDCDKKAELVSCPLCRMPIKSNKIKI